MRNVPMYKEGKEIIYVFPTRVAEMQDKGWTTDEPQPRLETEVLIDEEED